MNEIDIETIDKNEFSIYANSRVVYLVRQDMNILCFLSFFKYLRYLKKKYVFKNL